MKKSALLLLLVALFGFGCAGYRPIVDMRGVDMNRYHVDLGECQQYAGQVNPGEHAVVGAAAGAVLGAAIGAIFGNRRDAGRGAAAYGLVGAAGGGAEGAAAQREIVRRCMAGRGYRVLY